MDMFEIFLYMIVSNLLYMIYLFNPKIYINVYFVMNYFSDTKHSELTILKV